MDREERFEKRQWKDAIREIKRKATGQTPSSRLTAAVPQTQAFMQAAFAKRENAGSTPFKLLRLLDDLRAEVPHTIFRRRLTKQASPKLLVIDEVGYLSYDLLDPVVDRRYEKKPLVLTTTLAFREWNTVFPNATSIATLLDKYADITVIAGQGYRVHEGQKEAADRRKKG